MKSSILRLLLVLTFLPIWQAASVPIVKANPTLQNHDPEYIFPLPGSLYNQAGTTIALRYGEPLAAGTLSSSLFSVTGSASGVHSGQAVLALDGKTVIFKPDRPFSPQETVSVSVQSGISSTGGQTYAPLTFSFTIGKAVSPATVKATLAQIEQADLPPQPAASPRTSAATTSAYLTAPPDFPTINVTTPAAQTAEGYIFASNFTSPNAGAYLLMLDNSGEPVYYQKMPGHSYAFDFKELPDGTVAYWDINSSGYKIMDSSYQVIRTISAGNGFKVIDGHDLQLLPNGDYIYLIYDVEGPIDLSSIGGRKDAIIVSLVVQEQDPAKNIVFQWNSNQHIPLTDSNQDLTAAVIDYVHGNAVELDSDGNLLISARHLSEIIKIKHNDATFPALKMGDTIWTFGGGVANQFTFRLGPGISDVPEFYYQHDIRRLPNGHITLFDNHNDPAPQNSRAMEFQLDEVNLTATLVWEYRDTPDNFSPFMGNAQRLANGNTFIGWGGALPVSLTEVDPQGNKLLEMNFDSSFWSYRAYRFPWTGSPLVPPRLVLQPVNGTINLFFSWNGATDIDHYQIYYGSTPAATTLYTSMAKTGFETSLALPADIASNCYFLVVPVDIHGTTRLSSNVALNSNSACAIATYLPLVNN
jgi:hypothetical protein